MVMPLVMPMKEIEATGAIIRHMKASFMEALCSFLLHVVSVAMPKLQVMRDGLALANMMGCRAIQV